ncbi:uncharacterized protein LOC129941814 [Eupeodes corollae]|uniref:uncharacterized protein LOC129941814 n=1 Tax=Eupeodes corollae TaxID=290404 RepID=UPI002491FFD6|nr:uncharacterized protein LOC129941814 [Eupeodes corollae]
MDNETKKILLEYLLDSSSSSEESSSSSELDRLMSSDDSSSDEKHASVSNFMKTIEDYSELGFKSYFRLIRSTVEKLIEKYSQSESEQRTINSIKKIVVSVCILHNLCISNDDNITLDEEVTPQENNLGHNTNPELNTSRNRRETLFTYLCQTNII